MTKQEFFEIAGYFANPIRKTRIEIEASQSTINAFNPTYTTLTGRSIPIGTDSVYVLPNNADKWGREMRLYFTISNPASIPHLVDQLMTVGGRPGYDIWSQRLNSKDIIDKLFEIGFTLGYPQNPEEIRALIPITNLNDFNNGFTL